MELVELSLEIKRKREMKVHVLVCYSATELPAHCQRTSPHNSRLHVHEHVAICVDMLKQELATQTLCHAVLS